MTLVDLVTSVSTVVGLLASSIGIQTIMTPLPFALRAEGAACVALGVACLTASSLVS